MTPHAKRAYGVGVGDFCHVVSPHKSELPFIAFITEIRGKKAKLRWMYRAQDLQTQLPVKSDQKEIFYSSHSDWNAFPECVQSGIQVLVRAGSNEENVFFALNGTYSSPGEGVYDYMCKQEYIPEQRKVRPLSVDTLHELEAFRESTPRKRRKAQHDEFSEKHASPAAVLTLKEVPAKPAVAMPNKVLDAAAAAKPKEVPAKPTAVAALAPKNEPTKPFSGAGSLTKQQIRTTPLSTLLPGSSKWTTKAHVDWKGNLLHNVEIGQRSFFIVIKDMDGTSMRCQFVDESATLYFDHVHVGKAYSFSGGVCRVKHKEILVVFDKYSYIDPLEETTAAVTSLVDAKTEPNGPVPVVLPPPPPPIRSPVAHVALPPPPPTRSSVAHVALPPPPPPPPVAPVTSVPSAPVSAAAVAPVPEIAVPKRRGRPRLTPLPAAAAAAAEASILVSESGVATTSAKPPFPLDNALLDVLARSPKMKRSDIAAALSPVVAAAAPKPDNVLDKTPTTPAKPITKSKAAAVASSSLTLPPTKRVPSPSSSSSTATKPRTRSKPQFLPTPPDSSSSSDDSVSVYEEDDDEDDEVKRKSVDYKKKSPPAHVVLTKPALPIKSAPPLPVSRIKPAATPLITQKPSLPTSKAKSADDANKLLLETTTTTTSPALSLSSSSPSPSTTPPPLAKAVTKQYMLVHRSTSVVEDDEYVCNIGDEYQATLPTFRGHSAVRPKVDDYVYNFRNKSTAASDTRKPTRVGDIVSIMITDPKATHPRDRRRSKSLHLHVFCGGRKLTRIVKVAWYRVVGEHNDTIQCVPYESVFAGTQSCVEFQSFSRADVFGEYKEQRLYDQLGVAFSSSLHFAPKVGFHIPTLGDALARAANEHAQRALHMELLSLSIGSPLSNPQLFYAPKMRLVAGTTCSKCSKNIKNNKQGRKPILVYCARYFESCQVALCKKCFRGGRVAGFDSERMDAGSEFEEASYSHWFCAKCCAVPKDTLLLELEASKAQEPVSSEQQALQAFSTSAREILISVETKQASTDQALAKLCELFLQRSSNNAT